MTRSIKVAQDRIKLVSEALPLTLNEVLKRFPPDKYMKKELKNYLAEWGNRPVHEFIRGVVVCGAGGPDVWNGDMKPFNVLQVLDILCS